MRYWYDKEFKGIVCEPDCTSEWLDLICDVAAGYDGCNTVESLKGLVDEMVTMTANAIICLDSGKIFTDEKETNRNRLAAKEEWMKDKEG